MKLEGLYGSMRWFANRWRRVLNWYFGVKYSRHFAQTGKDLAIWGDCVFSGPGKIIAGDQLFLRSFFFKPIEIFVGKGARLEFGDRVFVNQGARIVATLDVYIGSDCHIGDEVVIMDSDFHGVGSHATKQAPVVIGNNVWIATRALILKGVEIGDHSVIGAGAVVTKKIPPYSLAVGVPARVTRRIS